LLTKARRGQRHAAEGWRDALSDLYEVLRKAEKGGRTRVPAAFRKALES
jgi:hypothetical protein